MSWLSSTLSHAPSEAMNSMPARREGRPERNKDTSQMPSSHLKNTSVLSFPSLKTLLQSVVTLFWANHTACKKCQNKSFSFVPPNSPLAPTFLQWLLSTSVDSSQASSRLILREAGWEAPLPNPPPTPQSRKTRVTKGSRSSGRMNPPKCLSLKCPCSPPRTCPKSVHYTNTFLLPHPRKSFEAFTLLGVSL